MEQQLAQSVPVVASTWRRFFNFVIDEICLYAVSFASGILLGLLGMGEWLQKGWFASLLFGLMLTFLYYAFFESLLLRTPGKLVTGTRVVMADGSKPEISTILMRSLIRLVPFDVISMYTGKETDKKGTWWHDRWSGTRVVRA